MNIMYILLLLKKTADTRPVGNNGWFGLDSINSYGGKIGNNKYAKILLKYEINDIKRNLEKVKNICPQVIRKDTPIIYGVIYDLAKTHEEPRIRVTCSTEELAGMKKHACEADERNFPAHAGFERNIIKIKVYAKYREECHQNIRKIVEQ